MSSVSEAAAVFGAEIGLDAEAEVAIEVAVAVEVVAEVEANVDGSFVFEFGLIREEPGTEGRKVKAGNLTVESQGTVRWQISKRQQWPQQYAVHR